SSAEYSTAWRRYYGSSQWCRHSPSFTASRTPGKKRGRAARYLESNSVYNFLFCPLPLCFRRSRQNFLHWPLNDFLDALAQFWNVLLIQHAGVDGGVEDNGDVSGPEHPVAGTVVLEGANDADRHDGNFELLGDAEGAVLKLVHTTVACALPFRKDDEAGAALDGVAGEAPHALEVGGAAYIGNGNVAEAFHEPAVDGDFKVRFELPAADKLRDGAI